MAHIATVTGTEKPARLLRLPEVLRRLPVSRSTWYQGIKDGRYPPAIKISARCIGWREEDIERIARGEMVL